MDGVVVGGGVVVGAAVVSIGVSLTCSVVGGAMVGEKVEEGTVV